MQELLEERAFARRRYGIVRTYDHLRYYEDDDVAINIHRARKIHCEKDNYELWTTSTALSYNVISLCGRASVLLLDFVGLTL